MSDFLKLKKRKDFVRVAKAGAKVVTTSFILQAAQSLSKESQEPKFGFTTTKKLGHAVVRNRARRRMRAAVRETVNVAAMNTEYVLIGRYTTAECPYTDITRDLKYALKRINRALYGDDYAQNSVVAVNSAD